MLKKAENLRVKLLYEQSVFAQATGMVNALIFTYVVHGVLNPTHTWLWLGYGFFIFLLRVGLQLYFRKHYINRKKDFNPGLWENLFAAGVVLAGSHWALAGIFLLPADALQAKTFLAFMLAGNTAGASIAYSGSLRAAASYPAASLLPFGFSLFASDDPTQVAMAMMMVIYMLTMGGLIYRMNAFVDRSIRLAFEKDHLFQQLKTTQAESLQSQKMAALGNIAGGVAHEINSPLAAIQLYMEQLQEKAGKGEIIAKDVDYVSAKVLATVGKISKIINALLAFSRPHSNPTFKVTSMATVIADTLNICELSFKKHGFDIQVSSIPEGATFLGQGGLISQALYNLLVNAFEATRNVQSPSVQIDVSVNDSDVQVAVIDNGPGVSEENRARIMEPFFTTKDVGQGPGLGLSTALGILKDHDGQLKYDPQGQSTRFVLTLPKVRVSRSRAA